MSDRKNAIKIAGYDRDEGFVGKLTFTHTMRALRAIADVIEDETVSPNAASAKIISELRYHSQQPHLLIDANVMKPITHLLTAPSFNGGTMGDFLFGSGWKEKIDKGIELSIPNEDIRAVIRASHPNVHIVMHDPTDKNHAPTQLRMQALIDSLRNKRYDKLIGHHDSSYVSQDHHDRVGINWVETMTAREITTPMSL